MQDAWEGVEWHLEQVFDAGEHVVSVVNQRVRGRTSGAATEGSALGVWTISKGKVVRVVWF
jgi:ketosteroid isomerase-like protein